MSILSNIFNPTILFFLGFTLLIVALLVVYFENKIREQNHKISSMLSLVSSLAEETNSIKNHLSYMITGDNSGNNLYESNKIFAPNNLQTKSDFASSLIAVSDNEDEDEDDIDDSDVEDDDSDSDSDSGSESDGDDDSIFKLTEVNQNDIKVLNLDNLDSNDFFNTNNNLDENDHDDGDDDEDNDNDDDDDDLDCDVNDINFNKLSGSDSDDDNYDDNDNKKKIYPDENETHLKTINISNLEETNKNTEVMDYKKLSLNKLKAIVLEKGLVSDPSKLKKNELLKLLIGE